MPERRLTKGLTIDRRGSHTKKSRALQRKERAKQKKSPSNCNECGADASLIIVSDSAGGYVCTNCGACIMASIMVATYHDTMRSSVYKIQDERYARRNYFAERIAAFCNTGPRITNDEEIEIRRAVSIFKDFDREGIHEAIMVKPHFAKIFRTLNVIIDDRYNTMLEKWLQVKKMLDPRTVVCDLTTGDRLKMLFDPIADTFAYLKIKGKTKLKNIPKLDILCLILLANIDAEMLRQYGWYFLNKEICLLKEKSLDAWNELRILLEETNILYATGRRRQTKVRQDAYTLLTVRGFKYTVPPLEELVNHAMKDDQMYGVHCLQYYLMDKPCTVNF